MSKDLKTNLMSDKIINVLKKFMIFENIESRHIKEILKINPEIKGDGYHERIAKLCQYDEGEIVINEGEFDSWSFWVVKGEFDVNQDGATIARFTKPGQIFGEMSVFQGIPRTASVVCKTGGICLCIDMSVIDNLKDKNIEPLIKEGFHSVILERIGNTKQRIAAAKKNLEIKYADLLEFESKIKSGQNEDSENSDSN